ncbi:MAG: hypothetical protein GDA52_08850 [Rhodobacteraceae bacterium]|nr:hypothetical protein [Paracoccaceae bacterium]
MDYDTCQMALLFYTSTEGMPEGLSGLRSILSYQGFNEAELALNETIQRATIAFRDMGTILIEECVNVYGNALNR